jgi:hypothetical protein
MGGVCRRTVEPSIGNTLLCSCLDCPPQRQCASSGVIMDMSLEVGIRSSMLSGVLEAGRPVEVMKSIVGKDSGLEVTMNKVPSAM